MRGTAKSYDELRDYCETLPIVDCHDHSGECGPQYKDAIQVIIAGYFHSDIHSASSDSEMLVLEDTELSLEERWPVLEKAGNALVILATLRSRGGCCRFSMTNRTYHSLFYSVCRRNF